MADWEFAQKDPTEELSRVHLFSMKREGVEFTISVKEFASPPMASMRFLATADKQVNRKNAPITPTGFGTTLNVALSECMNAIRRYPCDQS